MPSTEQRSDLGRVANTRPAVTIKTGRVRMTVIGCATRPVLDLQCAPDHTALLVECPAVPHTVIDINDAWRLAITIFVQQAMMTSTSRITPVTDMASQSTSDDKLSGPLWSSWRSFAVLQQSFAVFVEVLCGPVWSFMVL